MFININIETRLFLRTECISQNSWKCFFFRPGGSRLTVTCSLGAREPKDSGSAWGRGPRLRLPSTAGRCEGAKNTSVSPGPTSPDYSVGSSFFFNFPPLKNSLCRGRKITICVAVFSKFCQISTLLLFHLVYESPWPSW